MKNMHYRHPTTSSFLLGTVREKKGPLSSGQIQQVAAFNLGPNTNTIYYSNNTELATSQNISFGNTPWEFLCRKRLSAPSYPVGTVHQLCKSNMMVQLLSERGKAAMCFWAPYTLSLGLHTPVR